MSVCLRRNLTANLNDTVKLGIKSTKHGKFGRNIVCFLEELRPLLLWTFVTYYAFEYFILLFFLLLIFLL
jgi:hypothetical protein